MGTLYAGSACANQGYEQKNLTTELEVLRNTQLTIQKDIEDIKKLLQGLTMTGTPSPQNMTFNIDGEPFIGEKNATVVLVEFSDFECPFCARFHNETFPKINEEYISKGRIKYVVRDFPLESIHKNAFKAAQAAKCAGEQGRLWEMHDWLFAHQERFGPEFFENAQAIGLSEVPFQHCLSSGKHDARIRKSLQDGLEAGVQATPTFFVGISDPSGQSLKIVRTIMGAHPYPEFKNALEWALQQVQK